MASGKKQGRTRDVRPMGVKNAQAAKVRGGSKGKVPIQELHVTKLTDKTTAG